MLGWATAVILDGGPSRGGAASTIVDCTGERPRLLREGAIARAELAAVLRGLGTLLEDDDPLDDRLRNPTGRRRPEGA